MLINCGSVISLLQRRLVSGPLSQDSLQLIAANGSPIHTYGRRLLTLNLGLQREFPWIFTVADVPVPILGADFLNHTGFLGDIRRQRLVDPASSKESTVHYQKASVHGVDAIAGPSDLHYRTTYDKLLAEYADLAQPSERGAALQGSSVVHRITTSGPPVFERPRRLSGERLAAAKATFDRLLRQEVIRPSSSP
ncbi:PREDICTED: uncharacterized protein LOC107073648 [Polistes dominula]|uniref:Uncharacterized protein LOC107073648 n=1 Tax=Polistes dominula TaxID=743375 RepID=A0ABM1JBJ0_POLDO|nr:PREDICTED: uncharacterized protein LOC107073648 [Polistes dominula]